MIHLVRHAKAGDRARWSAADRLRPLDDDGRRQAEGLAGLLSDAGIGRIVSSPYLRCVQSVEPLAAALGLPVETDEGLAEGADYEDVLGLFRRLDAEMPALCTHGDVVQTAIDGLVHEGARIEGPLKLKKGSTWVLELTVGGRLARGRYLPPP